MTELTSENLNSELDSSGAGGSNSPLYVQKLNPDEFRKTLAKVIVIQKITETFSNGILITYRN